MIAPVVSADSLAEMQDAALDPSLDMVVADVRWYLDGSDGRAAYESAHLPGAIWIDLDRDLAGHGQPATEGRHPLPTAEDFAAAMSALGIGDNTVVIAYDDTGGVTAGRLVAMLRMLGRSAALLDGGLMAWIAEGRAVDTGARPVAMTERAKRASFTATPWPPSRLATADATMQHAAKGGAVLDARAAERFTGQQALIDPRPGHLPGARSAPWAVLFDADSHLRSRDELRAHFQRLGIAGDGTDVAYCGSGVSACLNVVAMEHAGFSPPRLFVASWSGWSADPARPAELGPVETGKQ